MISKNKIHSMNRRRCKIRGPIFFVFYVYIPFISISSRTLAIQVESDKQATSGAVGTNGLKYDKNSFHINQILTSTENINKLKLCQECFRDFNVIIIELNNSPLWAASPS